jgi:hypothetical protein
MYKLYLDDIRTPKTDGWVIKRSYEEAVVHVLEYGFPNYVSFDHDLGDADDKTGLDFAKFLVELDQITMHMPKDFDFNVHSANPVGAANIRHFMEGYLRHKKM